MKKILSLLLTVSLLCCLGGTVVAETAPQPRLNNTTAATLAFGISDSGSANVVVTCHGESDIMTKATAVTYIEKKTLLFFWTRVDIGTTDNVWTETDIGCDFYASNTVQLSSKGTYRAVTQLTVSSSGGADDVIDIDKEAKYE